MTKLDLEIIQEMQLLVDEKRTINNSTNNILSEELILNNQTKQSEQQKPLNKRSQSTLKNRINSSNLKRQ